MALPALAERPDLANAILPATIPVDEQPKADWLLEQASTLVRVETGRSWVDADGVLEVFATNNDLVWDALRSVTISIAARAWRNPAGVTQEATGPFSVSYGGRAADVVFLTDAERATLSQAVAWIPDTNDPTPGLWVLGTTRGPLGDDIQYAPVAQGGDAFPMLVVDETGPVYR